jgi:hypothetical protein
MRMNAYRFADDVMFKLHMLSTILEHAQCLARACEQASYFAPQAWRVLTDSRTYRKLDVGLQTSIKLCAESLTWAYRQASYFAPQAWRVLTDSRTYRKLDVGLRTSIVLCAASLTCAYRLSNLPQAWRGLTDKHRTLCRKLVCWNLWNTRRDLWLYISPTDVSGHVFPVFWT